MGEAVAEFLIELVLNIVCEILWAVIEGIPDFLSNLTDKLSSIHPSKPNPSSSDYAAELRVTKRLF